MFQGKNADKCLNKNAQRSLRDSAEMFQKPHVQQNQSKHAKMFQNRNVGKSPEKFAPLDPRKSAKRFAEIFTGAKFAARSVDTDTPHSRSREPEASDVTFSSHLTLNFRF